MNKVKPADDDEGGWGYRKYYLWINIKNKKYIREKIFLNENLSDYYDNGNTTIKTIYDAYLSKIVSSSLVFENINGERERDNYINSDLFKNNYKFLIKCIYAIDLLSINASIVLLSNIFDICNVVAFDLHKKNIVIIYNRKIYVIFYERENTYVELDLSESISQSIQSEIENFICQDSFTFDYFCTKYGEKSSALNRFIKYISRLFLLGSVSSLSLPDSLIVDSLERPIPISQLLTVTESYNHYDDIEQQQKWSRWNRPSDFLEWRASKENIYTRNYVHFKFLNLRDIYHIEREKIMKTTTPLYSLKSVCENLALFNHIYIHHDNLVYNNVIHVDFNECSFITLRILKENVCMFNTFSFLKEKNNQELIKPQSSFIFTVPHEQLNYYEFISLMYWKK